jgi:hypothetical protein
VTSSGSCVCRVTSQNTKTVLNSEGDARFHAEVSTGHGTETNADGVTHQHIKQNVVPPALVEVGQPVLERQLHKLEADAHRPGDARVSEQHGLAPPAEEVAENEDVERLLHVGPRAAALLPLLAHVALRVQRGIADGGVTGISAGKRRGNRTVCSRWRRSARPGVRLRTS